MHTSNLWHVPTLAVAPTFQVREKNQPQTKTPLANLTKNLLSLYFSCAFLGSFIWYHPQLKPSPEGAQLYASPWLYLLFFQFCGILELCIALRTELEVHPAQLGPWGTTGSCWEAPQTRGDVTSTRVLTHWVKTGVEGFAVSYAAPTKAEHLRGTLQECRRVLGGVGHFALLTSPRQTLQTKTAPEVCPFLRQTCLCHFTSYFIVLVRQREVVTVRGEQRAASWSRKIGRQ